MATDHTNFDPLRNPQVDYERADLSARGILLFLIGLFIAGVFIELVLWGMFRFMARSEALFPQGTESAIFNPQRATKENQQGSILQNTPMVNLSVFPQPRLQSNDAGEMQNFVQSEQKLLNPGQPFTDPSGAVHIPISLAMKLIEQRGLPTRPSAPPEINTQTAAGNPKILNEVPGPLPPGSVNARPGKASAGERKQR
ncbi:MAG TPA: hypothetical protein VL240_01760 [Candidatus Binatia bacterium]|nr:hypothetical protein [Candidatus Binatia bacterium]